MKINKTKLRSRLTHAHSYESGCYTRFVTWYSYTSES